MKSDRWRSDPYGLVCFKDIGWSVANRDYDVICTVPEDKVSSLRDAFRELRCPAYLREWPSEERLESVMLYYDGTLPARRRAIQKKAMAVMQRLGLEM